MALGLPRRWKEIAEYGPVSKCIVVVVPAFCRISEVQPCRSLSQRPRAGVCCQLGGEAGLSVGRGDRRSLTRRRRRLGLPPRRPMLWTGHGPGSPGKTPFAASPPLRRCSGGGRPPRASAPARATPPPANSCHGRRPQPPPATRCCGTASAPLHLDKGQRPHGAGVFSEARVVVVSLSERQSAPTGRVSFLTGLVLPLWPRHWHDPSPHSHGSPPQRLASCQQVQRSVPAPQQN
jgi:hypothetical protein